MAGTKPQMPIELLIAKGKKHLTKAEIEERRASEIKPIVTDITPPPYLTAEQMIQFNKIAKQLMDLKIMGDTDVHTLASFVIAQDLYAEASMRIQHPQIKTDYHSLDKWSKIQERFYKQARAAATDLGLTIASRCKLVAPQPKEEKPKENKFNDFKKHG